MKNNKDKFVLFLGTSHTAGYCQRGDQKLLDEKDMWHTHLSKLLNTNSIVRSRGGTENWQLTQMLIEAFDEIPNFNKRCEFVFAEVRLGSFWLPIPYDEMEPFEEDEWLDDDTIIDRMSLTVRKPEQIKKIAQAHSNDQQEAESILKTIYNANNIYYGSVVPYYRSTLDINVMYNLCKARGVPFLWTAFSELSANENIPMFNQYKEVIQRKYSELFSKRIPEKTLTTIIEDKWENSSCECGHWDEKTQPKIAQVLHKYIQQYKENRHGY